VRPRGKLGYSRAERAFWKFRRWLDGFVTVELLLSICMFIIVLFAWFGR